MRPDRFIGMPVTTAEAAIDRVQKSFTGRADISPDRIAEVTRLEFIGARVKDFVPTLVIRQLLEEFPTPPKLMEIKFQKE